MRNPADFKMEIGMGRPTVSLSEEGKTKITSRTMENVKLVLLVLIVAACAGCTRVEQLCQANIRSKLLNPETAEYYDFTPMNAADVSKLPLPSGMTFHTYRVRAESKLGVRVTTMYACASDMGSCNCSEYE